MHGLHPLNRHRRSRREGSVLFAALILALLASAAAILLIGHASQSAASTRRVLDYQRALAVAESGLDYGRTRLIELLRSYPFTLDDSELAAEIAKLAPPPDMGGYGFIAPNSKTAFRISIDGPVATGPIPTGNVAPGVDGQSQQFTITVGARHPVSEVGAVIEETVQAVAVHMIRYGVFYHEDLEIDPGPPMQFHGRMHGNNDLYIDGPLDVYGEVTAHGDIFHGRKDNGTTGGDVYIENESGQLASMMDGTEILDSRHPDWNTEALLQWDGNVQSGEHGVPVLLPPIDPMSNPHDLIEQPLLPGEPGYEEHTEREKLANNAALTVHVDSAGNLTVKDSFGTDLTGEFGTATLVQNGTANGKPLYRKNPNGHYQLASAGSFDTTQTFTDGRQQTTVAPVDIYVDQLLLAYPDLNSGPMYGVDDGHGVVYVTRDDPDGAGGVMPAVRLRNGSDLTGSGLTFATDLPVYIEGDYNRVTPTTAAVAGDAVTLLSKNWQDAHSTTQMTSRDALNTEYHTVILTGNSETVPGTYYNGGVENVLRFLEDWNGVTAKYRGSLIDLWYSEAATAPHGSTYYRPPNRDYGFDTMYNNASPWGIPPAFAVEQLSWRESSWEEEGWK